MASNITRAPLIRALARRGFAAAAQSSECPAPGDINVGVCQTEGKLTFASYDNNAPIVSVSVAVKAGSRYETPDALGASSVLRSCAGLATQSFSKFAIVRTIEEAGARLTAVNDRDTVTYTLECLRDQLGTCLPVLGAIASQQCFKPWEVSDNIPRLLIEMAQVTEQARVLDLLHTAAYRSGLGNSIFVPKFRSGLSSETLQYFAESTFGSNRVAFGAVGLTQAEAGCFAKCITLEPKCGAESSGTYYGGELRKPAKGSYAHVAIAAEGAGLNNLKDAAAFAVLKHGLGTGPKVLFGNNSSSPLAKAVGDAAGGSNFAVSAISISHSDSGLVGFNLSVDARCAGKAVEAAVNTLRSVKVSDELVARGKAAAQVAVLSAGQKSTGLAEELSHQALFLGTVHTPVQIASIIEKLSTGDISKAASKISSGKLSLAAMGDLRTVPYLADLK